MKSELNIFEKEDIGKILEDENEENEEKIEKEELLKLIPKYVLQLKDRCPFNDENLLKYGLQKFLISLEWFLSVQY